MTCAQNVPTQSTRFSKMMIRTIATTVPAAANAIEVGQS